MRRVTLRAGLALLAAAVAARADAIPAFARKYGMSCTACHVAWPILNQEGQAFRDRGYQFGLGKDDPVTQAPGYIPLALRTVGAYQYTRTTNQTADAGAGDGSTKPVTTETGGVPLPPGVDLLSAGTIAPDISFLVVITGFSPTDNAAFLESAWARLDNLGGSSWFNLKAGKFELDQPASSHRNVFLTYGYAAYGAQLPGSTMLFDLGQNQVGLELDGHDARSTTRYALALVSTPGAEANGPLASKGVWSAPLLYGHVQRAFETGSLFLPWVRVGALGAVGQWPTRFENAPAPGGGNTTPGAPLPGTGSAHKQFTRYGLELSGILGNPATPLFFTAAWIGGQEDAGLASGIDPRTGADLATAKNSFNGAFLEADWVPISQASENATPWMLFARYDLVRMKRGWGDTDGVTVGARRYLAFGPRASAAIHVELHQDKVKGTGWSDPASGAARDVQVTSALAGIDFDF